LSQNLQDFQETIIPVLDKHDATRKWNLRKLQLGIHLKGSVGFGVIKIGGKYGGRLVFTNIAPKGMKP